MRIDSHPPLLEIFPVGLTFRHCKNAATRESGFFEINPEKCCHCGVAFVTALVRVRMLCVCNVFLCVSADARWNRSGQTRSKGGSNCTCPFHTRIIAANTCLIHQYKRIITGVDRLKAKNFCFASALSAESLLAGSGNRIHSLSLTMERIGISTVGKSEGFLRSSLQ